MRILIGAALTALLATSANATPSYTETASAIGSLDGIAFTGATVTLFAAPTGAITHPDATHYIVSVTGSFVIDGFGSGTFLDPLEVVDYPTASVASINDATLGKSIFGTTNSVFSTYDLSYPITASGGATYNIGQAFSTNVGSLIFTNVFQPTFTATDIPEPLSLSIFGAGIAGMVAMRLRRKAT